MSECTAFGLIPRLRRIYGIVIRTEMHICLGCGDLAQVVIVDRAEEEHIDIQLCKRCLQRLAEVL
jgi:hypothetical protein